jgi:CelD/BcsL family acetyltransferase involved in cellulose biosynthesis
VSEESGKLFGLAPLYAEKKEDKQVLMLLGSTDVCDYLDCIVGQGEEERFYRALLSHLVSSSEKPVTLHFNSLQDHSAAISCFAADAHREGYPVEVNREDTAPALALPCTVTSYLNTLTKKDRHEIRRKKRRAEKEGTVTFHKLVHPSQVMEIFPRFIDLFRKTAPHKDAFLTPEREQFFLSVAEEFSRRAWLELFVLSFDKKEVAYLLSFHYNDTLYLYNAAYDPDYSSISPGIVAITYCLEDTISRGIKCFDFLRGDETYKYRFGARDNHLYRLTVHLLGEKKTCIA